MSCFQPIHTWMITYVPRDSSSKRKKKQLFLSKICISINFHLAGLLRKRTDTHPQEEQLGWEGAGSHADFHEAKWDEKKTIRKQQDNKWEFYFQATHASKMFCLQYIQYTWRSSMPTLTPLTDNSKSESPA